MQAGSGVLQSYAAPDHTRDMNPPVLNRDFAHPTDGWYHIEPTGEHPNRRAGVVQVIDQGAVASIVNRFNEDAARPDFSGLLVDHEHFRHQADKESRAYGWLNKLQAREDGIYGQIRWTTTGREAVDGGDYRFFSTEYSPADAEVMNRGEKPARIRPLRLTGLTLTNDPNNKGAKPITNRFDGAVSAVEKPDAPAVAGTGLPPKPMKTIATKLGLAAEASEDAILAEVTKLQNRAIDAEKALDPLKNRVTQLETENAAHLEAQVDADLVTYQNRFAPEKRDEWRKALIANRAFAVGLLQSIPAPTAPAAPVLNRASASTPPSETADFKSMVAAEVKSGKTKSQAIDLVINRNPEAYKAYLAAGAGAL
jgi:phage I-like protein